MAKEKTTLKGGTFTIGKEDPYGKAALRTYNKLSDQEEKLPLVLNPNDPAAKDTITDYLLRAAGAGDTKRAAMARKFLENLKGK